MRPYWEEEFGNPSSPYALGLRAKAGLEEARAEVADLLGCRPHEIIFTSGGSESNNMVLKGLIDFRNPGKHELITSSVEHPAILNPALYLMELGVRVTFLSVDARGRVDPDDLRRIISERTTLVSIMTANNEIGTLQPMGDIVRIAHDRGVPVHTDAAQAVGKWDLNVNEPAVDFLSVAGHKLYAPKGIGALYIREDHPLTPLVHGAGQEGGRRPGTENVILAAGLGAACRVATGRLQGDLKKMATMRNRLETLLFGGLPDLVLNGHPEKRLPNTLNVSVPGLEGAKILEGLPRIMASTGAACHDRTVRLSHVLSAMGVAPQIGMGALRFSVGRLNTPSQMEEAARSVIRQVKGMREGKANA